MSILESGRESVYLMRNGVEPDFSEIRQSTSRRPEGHCRRKQSPKSGFVSYESNKAQVYALVSVDNPRRSHQLVRDFDKWDIRVGQRNIDKLQHY